MNKRCTACNRLYASHALYCALCGKSLSVNHDSPQTSGGTRGLAVLLAAAVTAATAIAIYQFQGSDSEPFYLDPSVPMVWRELELPETKADMLYKLLLPNDIKVIVSRDNCFLRVKGTHGEVTSIVGFGELITRFQGVPKRHIEAHLSKKRLSKKNYELSRPSAGRLFDLLAKDDVPVWVRRQGRLIQIQAEPSDQRTLERFANILRGKRFR
ncbi:MAG: hypothetical protein IH987_10100 [Planctomycetes bacterium]|nr:hypothetical protein [Planctomycetota bacterium]